MMMVIAQQVVHVESWLHPALFGGIGSGEIVLILVVLLLLFGPKQLPNLARTIADTLRGIRKATDDMKEEIGLDEFIDPSSRRRGRYVAPPPRQVPRSLEERKPEDEGETADASQPPAPPEKDEKPTPGDDS